jgi:hypothetical protein
MHNTDVKGWGDNLQGLAEVIGNLRYDKLEEFLNYLSDKIEEDSKSDRRKGRNKLADQLETLSYYLAYSGVTTKKIWDICKSFEEKLDASL